MYTLFHGDISSFADADGFRFRLFLAVPACLLRLEP
jgi:hypothetical protein